MAKLADASDLGSGAERRGGSNPLRVIMKIHISLSEKFKKEALEALENLGLSCLNMKRFERYGIFTCHASESQKEEAKKIKGVRAVEEDNERLI